MSLKFEGLKSTMLSLVATAGVFALLMHFQSWWQSKLTIIDILAYPLLLVTAVFAAQFNHSRLTILCGLWALFLATTGMVLPWSKWLSGHAQWLILTGGSLFALLGLIKDRGLLSSHSVARLALIAGCGLLAFGWLVLVESAVGLVPKTPLWSQVLPHMPLHVPLAVLALLLLWRSLRQDSLTPAILLSSFAVWVALSEGWIALPWAVAVVALSSLYLLSVVVDSYHLAYRDELTGLPTRRALNRLALSLGRRYTVAMLDIDHFKKFNDTYGHDIGDQVLKLVAAKLTSVRGGGKVFRYGGEEFTVVFPRKSPEQAIPELEKLRQAIADYAMVVRQTHRSSKKARQNNKPKDRQSVKVTVSIGVAEHQSKQTFEQTLKNADLALYRAKKSGRNNVSS